MQIFFLYYTTIQLYSPQLVLRTLYSVSNQVGSKRPEYQRRVGQRSSDGQRIDLEMVLQTHIENTCLYNKEENHEHMTDRKLSIFKSHEYRPQS